MYKQFYSSFYYNQPISSSSEVNGRVGRAGYFSLFVLLVSCDCFVALPQSGMGCHAVCDCCISRSYALAFKLFVDR